MKIMRNINELINQSTSVYSARLNNMEGSILMTEITNKGYKTVKEYILKEIVHPKYEQATATL